MAVSRAGRELEWKQSGGKVTGMWKREARTVVRKALYIRLLSANRGTWRLQFAFPLAKALYGKMK